MSNHTPGPWECTTGGLSIWSGTGGTVAEVRNNNPTTTEEEAKANAHLIAAAPEMQEALEMLVENLDPVYSQDHICIQNAKAALAKSRGDANV